MVKNSLQKTSVSKSTNLWTAVSAGAAVVVVLVSGWAWWHYVRSNPERTFQAAVQNNLRTQGVSRYISQKGEGQSLEQNVQLSLGPERTAHGYTTIKQEGFDSSASIKTEAISTPGAEYVRYKQIETSQKNNKGKKLDFSSLIDIWGKSTFEGAQGTGEVYGESILGVVPTGNLSADDRVALMELISKENVYQFDADKVERTKENGRPVYVYQVTVSPEAYIKTLKQFAKAMGMKQLNDLDPANYRSAQALEFKVRVDVWSQQVVGVIYGDGQSVERVERMSGYGVYRGVDVPENTIPVQELQAKLQEVK